MFQIYIWKDNKLIDEIESDCIICAAHETKSDGYPTYFMADCDERTAALTICAEMENVKNHLTDEIMQASLTDACRMEVVEDEEPPKNGKGVN